MKNAYQRLVRFNQWINTPANLLVDLLTDTNKRNRAGKAIHNAALWMSPYTWIVKGRTYLATRRQRQVEAIQRQAEAAAAAIEASKPITLNADEFVFRNGGSMIRAILSGTIPDGSLDDDASEALDLQLVWMQHRDHDHKDFGLRAVAELKEAWLWRRCAQAMEQKNFGFYRYKAFGVAGDRVRKLDTLLSVGGPNTAQAVEQFATRTAGDPISVDAWHALSRANYDHARIAGGFHVRLGTVRQSLFSIGGFTLSARTPVYFNGPQSDAERRRQGHFWRQGDRARSRASEEQARQAAAARVGRA
jgi:hypothetical protein